MKRASLIGGFFVYEIENKFFSNCFTGCLFGFYEYIILVAFRNNCFETLAVMQFFLLYCLALCQLG